MARLKTGERQERRHLLLRLLKRFRWGIREGELSQELGWERCTLNNYLRELECADQARREGHSRFARYNHVNGSFLTSRLYHLKLLSGL
jgi:hypothetical protein